MCLMAMHPPSLYPCRKKTVSLLPCPSTQFMQITVPWDWNAITNGTINVYRQLMITAMTSPFTTVFNAGYLRGVVGGPGAAQRCLSSKQGLRLCKPAS